MIKVLVLYSENIEIIDVYGVEKCINILNEHPLISASKININDIHNLTINKANILLIAGGEPYQIRLRMQGNGATAIRKFIADGGGYIGICAGAVLAVPKAPTLDLLQYVKIVNDNIWWNSGLCGDVKLRAFINNELSKRFNKNNSFSYKNGPLFNIKKSKLGQPNTPIPLALFDGSLYNTNDVITEEMSKQINNSIAIIYGTYGNGSIIISSVHPEYDTNVSNKELLWEMCLKC